jgi:orotate phosphoribosyltransferase-like protein
MCDGDGEDLCIQFTSRMPPGVVWPVVGVASAGVPIASAAMSGVIGGEISLLGVFSAHNDAGVLDLDFEAIVCLPHPPASS